MPWSWLKHPPNPRPTRPAASRPGPEPPLQRLLRLVAEEPGVHAFIHRATADHGVVETAKSMTRALLQGRDLSPQCRELCRRYCLPESLLKARLWAVASLFPGHSVTNEDPYEILGVDPAADPETIKTAFRKLCLQCHPDLNQHDPEAATRFQQIKAAYDMVTDPEAASGFAPPAGTCVWEDSPAEEHRPSARERMRHLAPLGLVVVVLVLAVAFADLLLIQRPRSRNVAREVAATERKETGNTSDAGDMAREPLTLGQSGVSAEKGDTASRDSIPVRAAGGADLADASTSAEPHSAESAITVREQAVGQDAEADENLRPSTPVAPTGAAPGDAVATVEQLQIISKAPADERPAPRAGHETPPAPGSAEAIASSGEPEARREGAGAEVVARRDASPAVASPEREGETVDAAARAIQQGVGQDEPPAKPAERLVTREPAQAEILAESAPELVKPGPEQGEAQVEPAPRTANHESVQADKRVEPVPETVISGPVRQDDPNTSAPMAADTASVRGATVNDPAEGRNTTGSTGGFRQDGALPAGTIANSRKDVPPAVPAMMDVAKVEERLKSFLEAYAGDYSRRDLAAFMAHFTPHAVENSTPVKTLLPAYTENFRMITAMSYRIETSRWVMRDEGILFEGRFNLHGFYADGRPIASKGNLSMELVPFESTYRVQSLTYAFN